MVWATIPALEEAFTDHFPSQSGNFDSPSASDSVDPILLELLDNTRSVDEISPSGELVRALGNFYRNRHITPTFPHMSGDSPRSDRERRRLRDRAVEPSPLFVLPPPQPPQGGSSPRERAISRLAELNARRGRARLVTTLGLDRHSAPGVESNSGASRSGPLRDLEILRAASPADLQVVSSQILRDTGRRLDLARGFSNDLEDSPSLEDIGDRRVKRRKLDDDQRDTGTKSLNYGRYGQVEPGDLTMEIFSCDGGLFEEGNQHAAENVLRTDASVYCTKSNRCNLILQHQDRTPFSLKELVINAPHSGYTAP